MVIGIPLVWVSWLFRSSSVRTVVLSFYMLSGVQLISSISLSLFLDRRASVHEF
jgi:hypothetical protein